MQLHRYLRLFLMLSFLLIASLKAEPVPAQPVPRDFNIPSQSVASALKAYAQETNLQLLYPSEIVQGLQSQGVVGKHTPQEALTTLLQGSGLSFRFTDSNTVTVMKVDNTSQQTPQSLKMEETQVTAERDRVHGYVAEDATTATKTDTPLIETPQSISVVTRDQMDAQGAQTIQSALRYTAGVSLYEKNDNRFDIIAVRGFGIDEYLDGMRLLGGSFATPRIDPFFLERIEVLKGPASILYGQASPGGIYNNVSKRPLSEPLREITLVGGSFNHIQGGFDFSGPIDKEGKFLYRLTGLGRDADTQIKHVGDRRISIMPALTWRPSNDTTLTLLTSYQNDPIGGFINSWPALGTVQSKPDGKIPTSLYAGAPNFDKHKRTQYTAGYLFEHRFSDAWTVRQNFRFMHIDDDYNQVLGCDFTPPDFHTCSRSAFSNFEHFNTITVDNQAQAKLATGPLQHTVLFGADYQRSMMDFKFGFGSAPDLDTLNPNYNQPVPTPDIVLDFYRTRNQIGLYAQDQIKVGKWVFLFGGRQDWADIKTDDRLFGDPTTKQKDHAFTWRGGLVYLFEDGLAPYFSYSESFQPETGTSFSGDALKPTTGQQYEVGVKYQPKGFNSFVTLSLFHLTRQNVTTPDPAPEHDFFSVQTGEIRSRGVELEGKASLTEGLSLLASYAYLDNVVTKSNDVDRGKRPSTYPNHLASLWGDYTFQDGALAGLGFGAGVRYFGSTYGDDANTFKVPHYTLADAAIRYDVGRVGADWLKGWRIGVNVSNIADKKYVSFCANTGSCHYGLRREVLGTLSYKW